MQKSILGLAALLSLVACDGKKSSKNETAVPTSVGSTCTTVGATSCDGTKFVQCDATNKWSQVLDCGPAGKTCGAKPNVPGEFGCIAASGGNDSSCTVNGHTSAASMAFYDNDIFGYYTIDSYDVNGQSMKGLVRIFSDPGAAINTPISLSGTNANIQTCRTCVMAVDSNNKQYFANAGTITFTQLDNTSGGLVKADLSGLVLREIKFADNGAMTDVTGGGTWCLPTLNLTANVVRYPCYFMHNTDDGMEPIPGSSSFCGDNRQTTGKLIACQATPGAPQGQDPGQLVIQEDCAASSKQCVAATPVQASCQ